MMPLNQKNELAQVVEESTLPIEHNGGDGWTILHGDTLQIIRAFKPQVFDALITDPPYASGGWKPAEKNRTTTQKYSSMDPKNAPPDFDGDNRDQRSWTRWMAEWLYDARKACKPGAPVCLFIDWRQYPSITDALQWAGWIWRGCVVWDKMTSRPQKGRFRLLRQPYRHPFDEQGRRRRKIERGIADYAGAHDPRCAPFLRPFCTLFAPSARRFIYLLHGASFFNICSYFWKK